jgi:hypothetical protein
MINAEVIEKLILEMIEEQTEFSDSSSSQSADGSRP